MRDQTIRTTLHVQNYVFSTVNTKIIERSKIGQAD